MPNLNPFQTAIVRAVYGGILTGAAAFLGVYTTGGPLKAAVLAGASALVAYLIARGGVEGAVDSARHTANRAP